jgi:hypothetical protein
MFYRTPSWKVPMRLAGSIILTVAAFASLPSHAQTYDPRWPVCMKVYSAGLDGGGEWNDCSYTTIQQCQVAASGRPATCMINPYGSLSDGPWRVVPRGRSKAAHRS